MPRYRPRPKHQDESSQNWLAPVLAGITVLGASFLAYQLKTALDEESEERKGQVATRKGAAAKAISNAVAGGGKSTAGVADIDVVKKQFSRVMNEATTTGKFDRQVVDWFESFDPEKQLIETRIIIAKFFLLMLSIDSIKTSVAKEDQLPTAKEMHRCHRWLDFVLSDKLNDEQIGESINMRWNLAHMSKDFKKIRKVFEMAKKLPQPKNITNEKTTYYWQRLFQMACFLGQWDDVVEYGKTVATFSEIRQGRRQSMMQKYHTESLFNPKKYLNFLEIFKGAASPGSLYKEKFDPHLNAPLRFANKPILKFEVKLQSYVGPENREIDPEKQEWEDKYKDADRIGLRKELRQMWVFGAAMQLVAPSSRSIIPLCGPFNDSFVHASGRQTYQAQVPAKEGADAKAQPVAIATYKMEMQLNLVKKCPTEHPDALKGPGKPSPWLWEGTLDVPRFHAVKVDDPITQRPSISWTQLYSETYAVRLII